MKPLFSTADSEGVKVRVVGGHVEQLISLKETPQTNN